MKKLNLVFAILIALVTVTSCNKDDKLTPAETLVQYSPWEIDHIELLNVVNNGNTTFNQQDYLDDISSSLSDKIYKLSFSEDGTGGTIVTVKSTNTIDFQGIWTWEITADNQLKLTQDGEDPEVYKNFTVTKNQFEFSMIGDLTKDVTGEIKYICTPSQVTKKEN